MRTAAVHFALGYTGENWLNERKNYAAHSQAQLSCCAESFSNNGDNFRSASGRVPQGCQEQKAIQFCLKGLGHAILGNFSTDQIVIELTKISK